MALFQKNPYDSTEKQPLYTLGLQNTVMIVGLGNRGKQYEDTRHNIGFACIDSFAKITDLTEWIEKKDLKCLFASGTLGNTRVIAIKPTTFMNLSGEAVQAVASFYKITNASTVIIHDELDIPFGQIRTRVGGTDAGNNGIKSIIQHFGEDFGRVRIGIGPKKPPQIDGADFVLANFNDEEQKQLPNLIKETTAILTEYVFSGQLPHETRKFTGLTQNRPFPG
ncbi:aminoacyl-tRNA hydrolase [Candidatus Saccharibacteria bacterium]|nr:aminoacyl-tRNA hydrolase [Candidatus Saccharibacteria bacterium]MBI3338303.1 aminoacyl-tRNA hydrolase [Candidatus Saccharibacteria bacterium]